MYHCRKNKVNPTIPLVGGRRKAEDSVSYIPSDDEVDPIEQAMAPIEDGPINRGKSYFEYIKEAMKQKDFQHYCEYYGIDPFRAFSREKKNTLAS